MGLEFDYKDGQTPLDEEEKEGLKIKSITTQGELDEFEQLNIEKAVEWTIHTKFKSENIKGKDPNSAILSQERAVSKNACCKFNFLS